MEKCIFISIVHLLIIMPVFAAFLSLAAGLPGYLTPNPPRFLLQA
ncbi:putative membrane protein [Escherichia coli 2733950]|nr:putative membrane protein [Escherichia coli 2733950]